MNVDDIMMLKDLPMRDFETKVWDAIRKDFINKDDRIQVEAAGVGNVRHKRLVNLIGCCTEGDERLLVAEYMPHDTLSKHLFHCMTPNRFLLCLLYKALFMGDKQPLPWEMLVTVAYHIAQALNHCDAENMKIYHDSNDYRVLFDEVFDNERFLKALQNLKDIDSAEDETNHDNNSGMNCVKSFKAFRLLNAC
ncbi:hypothetical protein RHMOL_Rhmol01G0208200 [Rhododendron molle]|uniref:Uncharacterized protein n=1 Tax=Rhododendron molle TaxID=49168 RepID=A0ACC0Q6D4_RHOML|nr:hypothetical protein RHMOL_Rhmol01G0208200 [Rhododendron molle]